MKRFFAFLMFLFIPFVAMGNTDLDLMSDKFYDDRNISWQIDKPVTNYDVDISEDLMDELFLNDLEVIESKIKQLAPHVVDVVSDKNGAQRLLLYKNWLAYHAAQTTLKIAIEDMYKASRETGRAIKTLDKDDKPITVTEISAEAIENAYYWLDNGVLDTDACYVKLWTYKCPYPDDYREKLLHVDIYGDQIRLWMSQDVVVDGELRHVDWNMVYANEGDGDWLTAKSTSYYTYTNIWQYDKWYAYREAENKLSILNAELRELPRRKLKKIQKMCTPDLKKGSSNIYECNIKLDADEKIFEASKGVEAYGKHYTMTGNL